MENVMTTEVKVPALPESVSDGVVVVWHKQPGDMVERDEALVDIETDKVVLEVPAPVDGVLEKILSAEGTQVTAAQVIGVIGANGASVVPAATGGTEHETGQEVAPEHGQPLGPAVRKLLAEHRLQPGVIPATGKGGRLTKGDVLAFLAKPQGAGTAVAGVQAANKGGISLKPPVTEAPPPPAPTPGLPEIHEDRPQKRVPMSRLRARVAERMLQASLGTAMLTTFNEVDMLPVKQLREKHGKAFADTHGVRLGYMSFFVRAAAEALKRHPDINASIDGEDIVYHGFCDVGVAISTERGLVVPVLRNAEYMSLAEIETEILEFAEKGKSGKLSMEEITGGTFTITNGGVFGSMLSTPILNPPQSAILGMHSIKERPVVIDGEIVIRPIMYLALTYDHRIVDGKSAVTFLGTIIDLLEEPASMLLDL
jgi:2-oxoglutarate dehydrogenase E2 component (dihydrolipoamide succinyltransferase)